MRRRNFIDYIKIKPAKLRAKNVVDFIYKTA